jgi:hypothetical protein
MSVSRPTATEAEELLLLLQQSIWRASTVSRAVSAVHFIGEKDYVNLSRSIQPLEAAQAAVAAFGSLPPCPPTFRARLGLSMVWFINRLLWWHTAVSKRFATAMYDFAQAQLEEQANQQQLAIDFERRLRAIEHALEQIQQTQRSREGDRL